MKDHNVRIKIGRIVAETGVTRATVHHYVKEGLLPEPEKTSRNMALYDADCIERVLLIKGLQQRFRRSLAEVKTLLEEARGHEGLAQLHALVEREATSPLPSMLDKNRESLDRNALVTRTGFDREELDRMEDLGLLAAAGKGEKRTYAPVDVDVADALSKLAEAGFDREHGFIPEDAVVYLDTLQELLRKELALFLQRADPDQDTDELLLLASQGIERVTPLILALRRKLMHELIDATPLR